MKLVIKEECTNLRYIESEGDPTNRAVIKLQEKMRALLLLTTLTEGNEGAHPTSGHGGL